MKSRVIVALLIALTYFYILGRVYLMEEGGVQYPSRPITIIVHSKPGSAIDLMSRKIANLARKHAKVPFVIENRPGTQGLVAMQYVLSRKADGYTLLGVTRSFLSTVIVNRAKVTMGNFAFVANMLSDPEALITNKKASVKTIEDILKDARKKAGKQIWIGPGTGSRDHLMAFKTQKVLKIQGRWLDYKSGPQAVLAMLRMEAPVYVGNPIDIRGKPTLKIAAIAAPSRLKSLPDVPTFKELGYPIEEYMWRGYAFRQGVPKKAIQYVYNVLKKVSKSKEWKDYCRTIFALSRFIGPQEFDAQVARQSLETRSLLREAGLLQNYVRKGSIPLWAAGLIIFLLVIALLFGLTKIRKGTITREAVAATCFLWLAAFFAWQTSLFQLPSDVKVTHPAAVPGLWCLLITLFSLILLFQSLKPQNATENLEQESEAETEEQSQTQDSHQATKAPSQEEASEGVRAPLLQGVPLVLALIGSLILYFLLVPAIGYFLATPVFVGGTMFLLGGRRITTTISISTGFVTFSYLVFQLLLQIELPAGWFFGA